MLYEAKIKRSNLDSPFKKDNWVQIDDKKNTISFSDSKGGNYTLAANLIPMHYNLEPYSRVWFDADGKGTKLILIETIGVNENCKNDKTIVGIQKEIIKTITSDLSSERVNMEGTWEADEM